MYMSLCVSMCMCKHECVSMSMCECVCEHVSVCMCVSVSVCVCVSIRDKGWGKEGLRPVAGPLAECSGSRRWSVCTVAALRRPWPACLSCSSLTTSLCLPATNVEHPSCPPKPGYVRGFNHPCGCFCEPVPG